MRRINRGLHRNLIATAAHGVQLRRRRRPSLRFVPCGSTIIVALSDVDAGRRNAASDLSGLVVDHPRYASWTTL
jgi:hypothetical protein